MLLKKSPNENIVGKTENAGNQLPFSHSVFDLIKEEICRLSHNEVFNLDKFCRIIHDRTSQSITYINQTLQKEVFRGVNEQTPFGRLVIARLIWAPRKLMHEKPLRMRFTIIFTDKHAWLLYTRLDVKHPSV